MSEDPDLDAAEFVLGTLDRDERASFAARLVDEERAREAVAAWEARFAGLASLVDPIEPPADVWPRIERAIAPSAQMHPFKIIDGGQSSRPLPFGVEAMKRSRDRWRTGTLAIGAVAAALLLVLAGRTLQVEQPGDTYVAAVNRGGDKPALIVRVDLKSGQVLVRPVAAEAPAGRSLELWYIGGDKKPRSMGVLTSEASRTHLPAGAEAAAATFAVSVEPVGGSATGSPTGPVVYAGQLIKE